MSRRLVVPAVLAAVAVVLLLGVGGSMAKPASGASAGSAMSYDVVSGGPVAGESAAVDADDTGGQSPCVMRADCAGALVLGGLGLVLALPVMTPSVGTAAVPTTRVAGPSRLLRSMLWAARLHRPPQSS